MRWSDAAEVAIRPFATYARLAEDAGSPVRGLAMWLGTVACFVSWTTSGALLPEHLLLNPPVWLFAPAVQCAWLVLVARACGHRRAGHVIALFYRGHFPWLAFLMLVAAGCLFSPEPWHLLRWGLAFYVLPLLFLIVTVWCALLNYALFRAGLGLPRRQSAIATLAYYLGASGTIASWFLFTGQLLPLWGLM